jgi:hypothetical protein
MYAIYSTPYLDKLNKCYYDILIIEPRPIGKLTNMCKQIIIPNLTGTTDCSNCPTINKCIYAFISINDNSKLMQPNEIPNLFNKLIEEGFNINTDLTKMLMQTNIRQNDKKLLCYISS